MENLIKNYVVNMAKLTRWGRECMLLNIKTLLFTAKSIEFLHFSIYFLSHSSPQWKLLRCMIIWYKVVDHANYLPFVWLFFDVQNWHRYILYFSKFFAHKFVPCFGSSIDGKLHWL